MAFHIRNDEAEQMLRELQSLTGESLTDVVKTALSERLERERAKVGGGFEPLLCLWAPAAREDTPARTRARARI